MYLLFFISGFLFPKGDGVNIKGAFAVIKKKIFSLLIPWIASGLAYHYFRGSDITVMWFLMALFSFTVINIFWETIRVKNKSSFVIDIAFYFAIIVIMQFLIPQFVRDIFQLKYGHYLLFSLGIMTKRYDLIRFIENHWVNTIAGILFIVVNILRINDINIPQSLILTAVTGTICFWNIFKYVLTEGWFYEFMKTLGFYSLEVYIMHGFFVIKIFAIGAFIITLTGYMDDIMTRSTIELFVASSISVITITACLILIKATSQNAFIKFLLGKVKI